MGKSVWDEAAKTRTFKLDFAPTVETCQGINGVILTIHVIFALWYRLERMPALFWYDLLGIAACLFSYYVIGKGRTRTYTMIAFAELYLFMTLNMIFLGWEYGFQLYCFAFMSSAMLIDFYMHHNVGLHLTTKVFIVVDIVWYLFFRVWFYIRPPIYQTGQELLRRDMYLANATLTLIVIFGFIQLYIRTVLDLEDRLRFSATHDGLTGLSNRVQMQEVLDQVDGERSVLEACHIAVVDIDFFKRINDTWGHDAGDEVLRETARYFLELEETVPGLSVARWGGEEFVMLYRSPPGDAEQGVALFERVREGLTALRVTAEGQELSWTATIGVASGQEGRSTHALIQIADDRLYVGKHSGRNRVVSQTE